MGCDCPMSGYCKTLGRFMSPRMHELCKVGDGESEPLFPMFKREAEAGKYRDEKYQRVRDFKQPIIREPRQPRVPDSGPGTDLHRFLADTIGIKVTGSCGCWKHIREMNENGRDWCLEHIETILDWMEQEARKRRLPFVRFVVRPAVRRVIEASTDGPRRPASQEIRSGPVVGDGDYIAPVR